MNVHYKPSVTKQIDYVIGAAKETGREIAYIFITRDEANLLVNELSPAPITVHPSHEEFKERYNFTWYRGVEIRWPA